MLMMAVENMAHSIQIEVDLRPVILRKKKSVACRLLQKKSDVETIMTKQSSILCLLLVAAGKKK